MFHLTRRPRVLLSCADHQEAVTNLGAGAMGWRCEDARCPPSSLSLHLLPSQGHQAFCAREGPMLRSRHGLFKVSRASAVATAGVSWTPRGGFTQELICEASWERVRCPPSFPVALLGGPQAHTAPRLWYLAVLTASLALRLRQVG